MFFAILSNFEKKKNFGWGTCKIFRIELSNKFKRTQYKAMSAVRIYCTTWNWPKLSASSTSFTFCTNTVI